MAVNNDHEQQCIENWSQRGFCNCKHCNDFSEAADAVFEMKPPRTKKETIALIREKTGQPEDLAELHFEYLVDCGNLFEQTPDSGIFVGA